MFSEIVDKTINLNKNPEMGSVENLSANRPQNFRYLVSGNYKIIYYTNRETEKIITSNIFDTRQNPDKLYQIKES